jgi:hypothetical protein
MEPKQLLRNDAIEKLIDDDIDTIDCESNIGQHDYIYNLLKSGFCGYDKFSNKELEQEYLQRFDTAVNILGK